MTTSMGRLVMFIIFLILFTICCARRTLNIGMMFVKDVDNLKVPVGYRTSAGAIAISQDKIRSEHLLDDVDFNFTVAFDECDEMKAGGIAVDMVLNHKVDVFIGPVCNKPALVTAAIAAHYNIPFYTWGLTTSSDFKDTERFPTTVTAVVDSYSVSTALVGMLQKFEWNDFVFIYSDDGDSEKCDTMNDDLQKAVSKSTVRIAVTYYIETITKESIMDALISAKKKGRIIVSCFADYLGYRRAFLLFAKDLGMMTDEYVYIFAETRSKGFEVPQKDGNVSYAWNWAGAQVPGAEGREQESQEAFGRVFYLCDMMGLSDEDKPAYKAFMKQVIARAKDPPFNCVEDCNSTEYEYASAYSGQLHNVFYTYVSALNRTLAINDTGTFRRGQEINDNAGMEFTGPGGTTYRINDGGSRTPIIYLLQLNDSLLPVQRAKIVIEDDGKPNFTALYNNESILWIRYSGVKPLSTPICGFSGNECPQNIFLDNIVYFIALIILVVSLLGLAVFGIVYVLRARRKDRETLDLLWQIGFHRLQVIQKKSKAEASFRSFASGPSTTSTKMTADTLHGDDQFSYFLLDGEVITAMKHKTKLQLTEDVRKGMRKLRSLDHENLNKFLGIVLDGPQLYTVWKLCSRGSIASVIQKSSMQMDNFFVVSLIRDIAEGVHFIHDSHLKYHGRLTSNCCLVDDRWQVKVAFYGIEDIRAFDKEEKKNQLWKAPELLRSNDQTGTQEGDIYSFAIICSELVTKTEVYDMVNRKEKVEELVYLIKKGGYQPTRPELTVNENVEVNPALLHLIRDCWSERPSERPAMEQIKSLLKSMNNSKNENLMDHVFNMLESYASTLEEEVAERMKELTEEKKKSDLLLYRMLPKQVADKLKLGQSVEPETFDSVTIFFSDVVSFTTLASKCTPLQVVNLLNSLYTIFDHIIEKNDVYKVETIGDGYLCVSGLPHRNGNEHARNIANMSLELMEKIQEFRVPHIPSERVNIRIGIHSGSVVAGVVGLTMPRYCLFGDAVNTASRMESNSKPGRIHMSVEAEELLTKVIGGYRTEARGEVIIKGKGVMETFWLLGRGVNTGTNFNRSETIEA